MVEVSSNRTNNKLIDKTIKKIIWSALPSLFRLCFIEMQLDLKRDRNNQIENNKSRNEYQQKRAGRKGKEIMNCLSSLRCCLKVHSCEWVRELKTEKRPQLIIRTNLLILLHFSFSNSIKPYSRLFFAEIKINFFSSHIFVLFLNKFLSPRGAFFLFLANKKRLFSRDCFH